MIPPFVTVIAGMVGTLVLWSLVESPFGVNATLLLFVACFVLGVLAFAVWTGRLRIGGGRW